MTEKDLIRLAAWIALAFGVLTVPRAAETGHPSAETILRQVVRRSQAQHAPEGQNYYLCTKQTVTEDMDSSGKVTNRKIKVGETHSELGGAKDANKWSNKNGFNLDEELLRRYSFKVEKQEDFHGRRTYVLQFGPKNPPAPIRQFQDRLLNRATGTIWVDETDYELAKASIWLGESVSFGILGAVESFNFSFERAVDDEGHWMTLWTDTFVKARKFIIPIQTHKRVDWTDFKKLKAEPSLKP